MNNTRAEVSLFVAGVWIHQTKLSASGTRKGSWTVECCKCTLQEYVLREYMTLCYSYILALQLDSIVLKRVRQKDRQVDGQTTSQLATQPNGPTASQTQHLRAILCNPAITQLACIHSSHTDVLYIHRQISAEKKLVNKLLNNYSRIRQDGRPVQNDSVSVPVSFGLGLVQMELNEKDAVLILSMWTRYVSYL